MGCGGLGTIRNFCEASLPFLCLKTWCPAWTLGCVWGGSVPKPVEAETLLKGFALTPVANSSLPWKGKFALYGNPL